VLVPEQGRGMTVQFQAVAAQDCRISHLVEHTFE
jgi:hypothetical protein